MKHIALTCLLWLPLWGYAQDEIDVYNAGDEITIGDDKMYIPGNYIDNTTGKDLTEIKNSPGALLVEDTLYICLLYTSPSPRDS